MHIQLNRDSFLKLFGLIFVFLWIAVGSAQASAHLQLSVSVASTNEHKIDSVLQLPALTQQAKLSGLSFEAHSNQTTLSTESNTGFQPSNFSSYTSSTKKLDPLLRTALRRHQQGALNGSPLAQALVMYSTYGSSAPVAQLHELGAFDAAFPAVNSRIAQSIQQLGVLISLDGSASRLRSLGIDLGERQGDVVTARVTPDQLAFISQLPEVAYVEAGTMLAPTLDKSVNMVRADKLRLQDPTSGGRGVFIGAVDTGIDWSHLDFRVDLNDDGIEETSRIAYLWDQTEQEPVGRRGNVSLGVEYLQEDIEIDLALESGFDEGRVRERDENGHGTHVSGIQAGDGSASDLGFIGVAPQATIGFVKTTFSSNDVVDGVSYLFDRGAELGMPTIVNLSLGGHFGPHDGTSAFERALDSMVGPGRFIINSAGNEGNNPIHISSTLNRTSYVVDYTADAEAAAINIWYEGDADFTLSLDSPGFGDDVVTYIAEKGGVVEEELGEQTIVTIDNASQGAYPYNGDNNLIIILENIEIGSVWTLTLSHNSGPGRFDGWVGLSNLGEFSKSDPSMTISEPGNAANLITVGAYTSKGRWNSILGRSFGFVGVNLIGDIAAFSSHGPTRDGRIKPDITAPGTAVVSTLALESGLSTVPQLVDPDEVHVALQGTSMATPHVAGTIALMLEADPHLSLRDVLYRLRGTAIVDPFTGNVPNNVWGFGKLDSLEGVDTLSLPLPRYSKGVSLKVGGNATNQRAYFFYVTPKDTEVVQLMIFDARGKSIRTLDMDPFLQRHEWDLLDDNGQRLSNGLYLAVVVADGQSSKPQAVVIRND